MKAKLKYATFATVGLLVGVVLGVAGTMFLQNYNPPDEEPADKASVVFERIVSQNEMVSVSQKYCIVDKASTESLRLFDLIDLPWNSTFWYRYEGELKAGVDLRQASFRQVDGVIYVTLGDPYIISNTPDMEKSGVLEEHDDLLNPLRVDDVDAFQAQCFQRSKEEALEGGILDEARTEAETNIRNMFIAALGDECEVVFE